MEIDATKLSRFLLTFFLGFIGSFVINHSTLKPEGAWKSRTASYFFLGLITFGIYQFVAANFNLVFDPKNERNVGYFKEIYVTDTPITDQQ